MRHRTVAEHEIAFAEQRLLSVVLEARRAAGHQQERELVLRRRGSGWRVVRLIDPPSHFMRTTWMGPSFVRRNSASKDAPPVGCDVHFVEAG